MKYLLALLLLISVSASAQYSPTATKTRFVNGIGLGTKDTTSMNAADTTAIIVGRDSLIYFRYKGFWKPLAYAGTTGITNIATNSGTGITGGPITSTGTIAADTLLLSTRAWRQKGVDSLNTLVNLRVKYTDTSTMLNPYLRKIDTTGKWLGVGYLPYLVKYTDTASMLSPYQRSYSAVKYSDTASMLSPYYRTATANAALALKVNYTDTSTMLSPYQRSYNAVKYTDTATMLTGYKTYYPRNAISAGTGISYNPSTGVITNASPSSGGTVTSVATDVTLTGGPITTSGTLKVDTTIMATRLRVQKGIDSLGVVKLNISDTAAMLSPYQLSYSAVKYSDTASMLSPYARSYAYIPYIGATSAIDLNAKTVVNISHLGINTTTVPTIALRAIGDNNSTSRIAMRGYSSDANGSSIRVTKFRGTVSAPQAPQSGDNLGKFELAGYGTTSSEGYPQATFEALATENWGATARGAKIQFKVTPNTTTTQAIALTINQDKSAVFESSVTGTSLIKTGGTSAQFLKADGSVTTTIPSGSIDTGRSVTAIVTGGSLNKVRDSLQANIGLKLNISDTATMLSPYARSYSVVKYTDTASMLSPYYRTATATASLALKLNISDTATMLSSYYNKTVTDSKLALKVNYTDTSTMLSPYQRAYSAMKYTDTSTMLSPYLRSATATATYQPLENQRLSTTNSPSFQTITTLAGGSNPLGKNISVGDDVFMADRNIANTLFLKGLADSTKGFISFGGDANTLGYDGTKMSYNGSFTASSLIKSGGTSAQILAADGSVITAGTNITISGGTISASGGSGSGTVTSIATNNGSGITGGTITTSGTLAADTVILATRLRVQKGIDSLGGIKQANLSLSAIGSTANANGATLTGAVLNLQPASASFGGVVTTGTQSFAGTKTFSTQVYIGLGQIGSQTEILQIKAAEATINLQTTTATSYSGLNLYDAAGALGGSIQYGNASAGVLPNTFFFGPRNATGTMALVRGTGATISAYLDASGNFGINTTTIGNSKFQVNGSAAIGYSANTTAPTNGLAVAGGVTIGTATNNVSSIAASGYSLTGANAQSLVDLSGTWNTTGNPTAIKLNVTNTASGATSNLMDLQVGGVSKFLVDKGGAATHTGQVTITSTSGTIAGARNALYLKNAASTGGQSSIIVFGSAGTASSWQILNDINADGTTINQLDILNNGTTRMSIASTGAITFSNLAGTGSRMVVADASGTLSAASIVTSGTYTPTIGLTANASAATGRVCQYMRVGSVVTVSGYVSVTATTPGVYSRISMTLPVASTFTNSSQAGGSGGAILGQNSPCTIFALASATTVSMDINITSSGSNDYWFSYTYQIL